MQELLSGFAGAENARREPGLAGPWKSSGNILRERGAIEHGMSYRESITDEELGRLPRGVFPGEIVVVETEASMRDAFRRLNECSVLGFDTETRPSFLRGKLYAMSLVQLSSETTAFLLRLNKVKLSPEMIGLLENERILKVGASIRDDIKGIQKQFPFRPGGFLDVQSLMPKYGISEISVRKMSAIVLGVRISKAQRLSNWEAQALTPAQQLYAATDAWICREIYLRLTRS